MESPPKRMTRARAAAKATGATVKTTRIVTAAARAKATTTTSSSKSISAKRKTPADELDDDDADELEDGDNVAKRPTRGRPRKNTDTSRETVVTKTTARGRPAKKAATSIQKEPAPPKAPRGRPRKNIEPETDAIDAVEETSQPTKRTARSRATTAKTAAAKSDKPTVKKVVKFQEPDKENDGPVSTKDSTTAGGMRVRPARRAPTATSRTTQAATKGMTGGLLKPLSPKKVTQIPVSRMDSSEDELAGGDTPLKRMQRQPIKPPSDLPVSPRKPAVSAPIEDTDDSTLVVNNAILNPPDLGASSLGSPARRPPASPFKESMKSPARKMGPIQLPTSMKSKNGTGDGDATSPSKSLLQSAAKRPQSPVKGLLFGSSSQSHAPTSPLKSSVLQSPAKRALPGYKPRQLSPEKTGVVLEATPGMKTIMSSPTLCSSRRPSEKLFEDLVSHAEEDEDDVFTGPVGSLKFPGRMSAVLPRDSDPAEAEDEVMSQTDDVDLLDVPQQPMKEDVLEESEPPVPDQDQLIAEETESAAADTESEVPVAEAVKSSPAVATPAANPMYQLRAKDLDPCHEMSWDSEDDLSPTKGTDLTMSSFTRSPSKSRRVTMGLSSLADQLGSWSPAAPIAPQDEVQCSLAISASVETVEVLADAVEEIAGEPASTSTPTTNSFFEQEMSARASLPPRDSPCLDPSADQMADEPIMEDIMVTDEDVQLAQEANEMSLEGPETPGHGVHERSFSDDVSEASQEYADENQVPVDPELVRATPLAPVTPVRPAPKTFNTTTKIPLKPADHSTPSPMKKRSLSASRVAPRRPGGPTRNATVISYQPTRKDQEFTPASADIAPSTPAKSDIWSSMGTPARTPRKDINTTLLKGAVVFVDVHTSEGADASGIFIDLLNQMGARCVKTWNWTPEGEGSTARCGITHVVFKDGGKRTMERVRQAKGVVHCVGVTWVLDCERENEWLDESPYYIDRSFVPRGGARRRKSMEPKTLANMNGTLVNSGNGKAGSARDVQSTPKTPMNRRQSTVWMHTPSDQGEEDAENDDDYEWSKFLMLTPVPKTPAPEAVARYAADIPTSPSEGTIDSSPTQEDLLMRTCPPKSGKFRDVDAELLGTFPPKSSTYEDLGVGILGRDKDEHVRMRLMAARRKSLQFAPKIGSPLARAWK